MISGYTSPNEDLQHQKQGICTKTIAAHEAGCLTVFHRIYFANFDVQSDVTFYWQVFFF